MLLEKLFELKNINRKEWTKQNTEEFCQYLKESFWNNEIDQKVLSNINIGDMIDIVWSHTSTINDERVEEEFYDLAIKILNKIKPLN